MSLYLNEGALHGGWNNPEKNSNANFYTSRPFVFLHGSWQSDSSKGGKAGTTTDLLHLQKFHDRTVRNMNYMHKLCTSYDIASNIS